MMAWLLSLALALFLLQCSSAKVIISSISSSRSDPAPPFMEETVNNKLSYTFGSAEIGHLETSDGEVDVDVKQGRPCPVGLPEKNTLVSEGEERKDWGEVSSLTPHPPPMPHKEEPDIARSEHFRYLPLATPISMVPATTPALSSPLNIDNVGQDDQQGTGARTNLTPSITHSHVPSNNDSLHNAPISYITEISVNGKGMGAEKGNSEGDGLRPNTSSTIDPVATKGTVTVELLPGPWTNSPAIPSPLAKSPNYQSTVEEGPATKMPPVVIELPQTDKAKPRGIPLQFGGVFPSESALSGPAGPCVMGLGPCVVPTDPNGTSLLWEDLSRTLAFAWELHVFGSAGLYLLLAGGAGWGLMGGVDMLHPICDALTMANVLLLLAGLLRSAHFLTDPYGTRRILPRPALMALYNLPLPLLLWAQAALALLALRGERLNLLPPALQCPPVAGGLATLHCSLLLLADLLSQVLSPALSLMLQTLSICWGLPLCLGTLFQALVPLHPSFRMSVPWWGVPKRVEERARRVLAVCAFLGALCCGLQIHSLLWLYGLLGDWRRFGWGWWMGQFWARLLELAWSFSLLLLGSWVFWRPRGSHRRGKQGQGRAEGVDIERGQLALCWDRVLQHLPMGRRRRSETNWAEFMPNNWAVCQRTRTDISSSMMRNYDTPPTTHSLKESNSDNVSSGTPRSSVCDSNAAPMWSRGLDWGGRECILSLTEFELCPASPIDLSRSIDNALLHGHLLGVGSLFTPPPSWTQSGGSAAPLGGSVTDPNTPTHIAYRWSLDGGLSHTISPQHFRTVVEQIQPVGLDTQTPLPPQDSELQGVRQDGESKLEIARVNGENDWSSVASSDGIADL